jgi:hypothetical protein
MRRILYGVTWEDHLKLLDATSDLYLHIPMTKGPETMSREKTMIG